MSSSLLKWRRCDIPVKIHLLGVGRVLKAVRVAMVAGANDYISKCAVANHLLEMRLGVAMVVMMRIATLVSA